MRSARSLFHCDKCGRSFSTKGHLKEHLEGVHGEANRVQCPLCGKAFNTDKRMKKHLYSAHKESADGFRTHSRVEAFVEPDSSAMFVA